MDLIFEVDSLVGFVFYIEICEDVWVLVLLSDFGVFVGVFVFINLLVSNIVVGKVDSWCFLCQIQFGWCWVVYVYVVVGYGEFIIDFVWDGYVCIYEFGEKLVEFQCFLVSLQMIIVDVDIE